MIKWIIGVGIIGITLMSVMRVSNALLINYKATLMLNPDMCQVVSGEIRNGMCWVIADLSHTLIGNPIIRLESGKIVELKESDLRSYSFTISDSHHRIGW